MTAPARPRAERVNLAEEAQLYALPLADDGAAPTEFRVFAKGAGVIETTKGPLRYTAKSEKAIAERMRDMGQKDLPLDYGHGHFGFASGFDSARAAGWFKVDFRPDGLYATDIQWTPTALQALKDREFRFFSPALMRDYESGEVTELLNIALTNVPATKRQKPLVASDDPNARDGQHPAQEKPVDEDLKALLSACGASDVGAAKANIGKLVEACQSQAMELSQLRADAKAREEAAAKKDHESFVTKLSADGVLPPALQSWALGQSRETLEGFAKAAPAAPPVVPAPTTPSTGESAVKLSEEERHIALAMGLNPEEVQKHKAEVFK